MGHAQGDGRRLIDRYLEDEAIDHVHERENQGETRLITKPATIPARTRVRNMVKARSETARASDAAHASSKSRPRRAAVTGGDAR